MKSRILVVDDEKEIADLLEIYLKSEDYDVLKCYDGTSAAELILTEQVDLAILDIMLPGKSLEDTSGMVPKQFSERRAGKQV